MTNKVYYEQPLNERVRTLLRLEFLFDQVEGHLQGATVWDTRAALAALLDFQNILGRTDVKTELIKELERYATFFEKLEANPNVDNSKLTGILDQVDGFIDQLHALKGPAGAELKKNELLNAFKQRLSIPGGTCDFDLPALHFWLTRDETKRKDQLREWFSYFEVIQHVVELVLRLLRESATPTQEIADGGFFQQSLDPNTPYQLVRVGVPEILSLYPEISGGKHRFTVRFLVPHLYERDEQTKENISFELSCCQL